jgi:excisionase family DNA binding protein
MAEQVADKKALTFDEGRVYIGGISRPTMYSLIGSRAIPSYTIGRRRYILRADLDAFLEQRIEAGDDNLS